MSLTRPNAKLPSLSDLPRDITERAALLRTGGEALAAGAAEDPNVSSDSHPQAAAAPRGPGPDERWSEDFYLGELRRTHVEARDELIRTSVWSRWTRAAGLIVLAAGASGLSGALIGWLAGMV
jgi:hypothetical protein